jgi:poly-gamma-glutamate synthesis protein (capsule biosynthesis protein)
MQDRRRFLRCSTGIVLGAMAGAAAVAGRVEPRSKPGKDQTPSVRLFLCGDVMLGRGIDQVLPHPSDPVLHETYVGDARDYLELARRRGARIPVPANFDYVWGDALDALAAHKPQLRIVNLETSITRNDQPWPKGIHYRMHPRNAPSLVVAGIDCCVLANNHVLDWGREGLLETLRTLRRLRIASAGAGADQAAARAPAILPLPDGARVLVFAAATDDSGVPESWDAETGRPGVWRLPDLSDKTVSSIAAEIARQRHAGDRVVFSLHWGDNWGYGLEPGQRAFAHALIDDAGVDLVHGHSSHHPRALEVHRGHLILYGCGDFLNDYEGISGHESYRAELGLMYFPVLDGASGKLRELELVPTRVQGFRVNRASDDDRRWLLARLQREYARFGCRVVRGEDGDFSVACA